MAHFIGKTISLISKADIRYVGVLHDINSQESTVSLRNVRSYGTEGRVPGQELPASDHIYEYIVFRGSDVKDLTVSDPTSSPAPPPANDPPVQQQQQSSLTSPAGQQGYASYVATRPTPGSLTGSGSGSLTSGSAPMTSSPAQQQQQPSADKPSSNFGYPAANNVKSPGMGSQAQAQLSGHQPSGSQSFASAPVASSSEQLHNQQSASESVGSSVNTSESRSQANKPSVATAPSPATSTPSAPAAESSPVATNNTSTATTPSADFSASPFGAPNFNTNNGGVPRGPTQSRPTQPFSGRPHHQGPRSHHHHHAVPQSVEGEFDFAEMNAKFSKTDIAKEIASEEGNAGISGITGDASSSASATESVIPKKPKEAFYDKKSSFFDNISSTTKERIEGVDERPRRSDERRLNVETFGSDYVYKNTRGGYRGNRRGGGNSGNRGNYNGQGSYGGGHGNQGGYGGGNGGYRGGHNNNGGGYYNSGNSGYRRHNNNGGDQFGDN